MATDAELKPQEDWKLIGKVDIRSRLSISDSSYFYDDPLIIDMEAGNYLASVRYVLPEGHKHIAGVRVAALGPALSRARWVGNVLVDFGQIGICDRDAVEASFNLLGDDGMSQYYNQLNTIALVDWVQLPGSTKMLILRPGFGDGSYPVYELLRPDGTRGGIEIDCLHPVH
jgi:hypothetical protein